MRLDRGRTHHLGAVGRRQEIHERIDRLVQIDDERAAVRRLIRGDVREHVRGTGTDVLEPLEAGLYRGRVHDRAVMELDALAEVEGVLEPVIGDAEVLGEQRVDLDLCGRRVLRRVGCVLQQALVERLDDVQAFVFVEDRRIGGRHARPECDSQRVSGLGGAGCCRGRARPEYEHPNRSQSQQTTRR